MSFMKEAGASAEKNLRHRQRTGRPYVTLTYAQSLDGAIAARPGHPLTLSCRESQAMTHALRAEHDAILVGIGTILADNPSLTVRLVSGKNPQPVVLDSRLRFPLYAKLLRQQSLPWIMTNTEAESERQEALESLGAKIFRLPTGDNGGIEIKTVLEDIRGKRHQQRHGGRRGADYFQLFRVSSSGSDHSHHCSGISGRITCS